MLRRTHLALGLAAGLYFLPHIRSNKLTFLIVVLAASLIPDIESGFAATKRHRLFSIQQTKWVFHRNLLLHTYTFLIIVSLILAIYSPPATFPFFLGYSFHLFIDSFSPKGIRPFWPAKKRSTGRVVPGGRMDKMLFYIFLLADAILVLNIIF